MTVVESGAAWSGAPADADVVLSVRDLRVVFSRSGRRVHAVNGLSYDLRAGRMLAIIGDSENAGSIGLHAALGFRQAGVMRAVGWKFGRWLDVVTMQRALGEGEKTLPE